MTLYAGDKGPAKTVAITIATGAVPGTSIASVRLRVRYPDGTEAEWLPSVTATSAASVTCAYALETDGSSVPLEGSYYVRAWGYSSLGAQILDTDEALLRVSPSRHTWPV